MLKPPNFLFIKTPSPGDKKNFDQKKEKNNMKHFYGICATIRIGREIQCLPCAGFFLPLLWRCLIFSYACNDVHPYITLNFKPTLAIKSVFTKLKYLIKSDLEKHEKDFHTKFSDKYVQSKRRKEIVVSVRSVAKTGRQRQMHASISRRIIWKLDVTCDT